MKLIYFQSFDGEHHYKHPNSTYGHFMTSLANIHGSPLAVGGRRDDKTNIDTNKAEIFDINANMWKEIEEYPYHQT